MRLELAAKNITDPWTSDDLEIVLKNLKNGTSRDPYGFSNELFKKGIAGKYLKVAILKLMNKIKSQQKIPKSLQLCNISSLYKNTTVLRSILDRLIYNDIYETIDLNLTDCNVGNQKN